MMRKDLTQPAIKVWYSSLPESPKTFWPIIPIRLEHKSFSTTHPLNALVDSGASISVLHPFIAEASGFDFKKLGNQKTRGTSASGSYQSWILPEPVVVDIYGYSFRLRFTVIDNPKFMWPCILGEDSIFEFARLDFQKYKGFFEIRFRSDMH